ncbi:MAG: PIN domain-containing protein [Trueperaceae bacterium]
MRVRVDTNVLLDVLMAREPYLERALARQYVRRLLELFDVASVDRNVLVGALDARFGDFEDGVLHEAARATGADAIVARDRAKFAAATLPVFTPEAFLAALRGAAGADDV